MSASNPFDPTSGPAVRGALYLRLVIPGLLWLLFVAAPPARVHAADEEAIPIDRYFHGRVRGFDGKELTLHYDFSSKEQLDDWRENVPFPITKVADQAVDWFDERLQIQGSTGADHRACWTGNLEVHATLTVDAEQDVGAFLVPSTDSQDFATFTLVEKYFHAWDGNSGGGHGIIKFGKQWRERGSAADFIGFRYVIDRAPPEPLVPGRAVDLAFGLSRGKLFMRGAGVDLEGKDLGKRLKIHRPGFYAIKGRLLVDDVTIRGRLDPAWMKEAGIAPRLSRPIEELEAEIDSETLGLIEAYAASGNDPSALVAIVGSPGRTMGTREAAAEALRTGPKRAARPVLDLLYSEDETTRELGIGIVAALLGNHYKYKAGSSESLRRAAIRRINEDLREHPELLQDGD